MFGPGRPRLLAQLPPGEDEAGCAYVIEWTTPVRHFECLKQLSNLVTFYSMPVQPLRVEDSGVSLLFWRRCKLFYSLSIQGL